MTDSFLLVCLFISFCKMMALEDVSDANVSSSGSVFSYVEELQITSIVFGLAYLVLLAVSLFVVSVIIAEKCGRSRLKSSISFFVVIFFVCLL